MKPGSEPERWVGIAEKLLAAGDLIGSKSFAERALCSDPLLDDDRADQIIAVADVLLASQKRINNHLDWYSILNLNSSPDDDLNSSAISVHFRRLARLLHPTRNQLPLAANAFKLVSDAHSVLSDPVKKSLFDSEIRIPATAKAGPPTESQKPQFGPVGRTQSLDGGEKAAAAVPPPAVEGRKKTVAKKRVGVNLKRKIWGWENPVRLDVNEEDEDQVL